MQFLSLLVNKEDVQVILSSKHDQHQFSSNNITTQSRVDAKVMRMIKCLPKGKCFHLLPNYLNFIKDNIIILLMTLLSENLLSGLVNRAHFPNPQCLGGQRSTQLGIQDF